MSREETAAPGDGVHRLANCSLRPLGEGEVEKLARGLAVMEPWSTLRSGAPALAGYLTRSDPALQRRAVEVERELAGVLCVRHPWLRGPFVELVALLPGRQRRGLGREILTWVEDRPEWGRRNVWATVSAFNTAARSFYAGCGYEEVAWLPGLLSTGQDEILLRRRLDPRGGKP